MARTLQEQGDSCSAEDAELQLNMFLGSCHRLKNTLKALGVNLIWCLFLLLPLREFLCPSLTVRLQPRTPAPVLSRKGLEEEGQHGMEAVPAKPLLVVQWERKTVWSLLQPNGLSLTVPAGETELGREKSLMPLRP